MLNDEYSNKLWVKYYITNSKIIIMKKILVIVPLTILCLILNAQQIFISPNGEKKVTISKISKNKFQVIVNNTRHNYYKEIVNQKIYFFADSYEVAYIAKCDDGYCVVINGVEQKHYKAIIFNKIEFSPDSLQYAYSARIKMRLNSADICWVINGEERILYNVFYQSDITFSPDSKHWAYAVKNNKGGFYIIDGLEQTQYNGIALTSFTFSPDSKHWKYRARKDNNWFYNIDGKETMNENTALFTSNQLLVNSHTNEENNNISEIEYDSISLMKQNLLDSITKNNEADDVIIEQVENEYLNLESRDLIILNKGDSLIYKIKNEDSLNVYILLQKNDKEIETFVEKKQIDAIEKKFYTYQKTIPNSYNSGLGFICFGNSLRVIGNISFVCALGSGIIYIANENEKYFNACLTFGLMYPIISFNGSFFSCIGATISDPSGSNDYWKKFGTTILPIAIVGYGIPLFILFSGTDNIGLLVTAGIVGGVSEMILPWLSNNLTKEIHRHYAGLKNVNIYLNPAIDYNNNLMAQLTLRWTIQ